MNKKHITHGKLKVFMILFLAVILIVLVVVCAKKIKLSQNEKNIIGTWKNSNSENVITVQDSDTLILYNDIPEAGLYHGINMVDCRKAVRHRPMICLHHCVNPSM
mgnify:CR=1 FL=1